MDEEDDAPPMLIAADGNPDPTETSLSAEMEDVKIAKVPITIITGTYINRLCFSKTFCIRSR